MRSRRNWWGLRCLIHACPFRTATDETGIWGECVLGCGRRSGFVSREELRRFAEREQRRRDLNVLAAHGYSDEQLRRAWDAEAREPPHG